MLTDASFRVPRRATRATWFLLQALRRALSKRVRLAGYSAGLFKRLDFCFRPPVGRFLSVRLAGYSAGLLKRLGWLATRVLRRATRANKIDAFRAPRRVSSSQSQNFYSCCSEVGEDVKNLASWQGLPVNIYVYLIVDFTTLYIYYYFITLYDNEVNLKLRVAIAIYRLLYNEIFTVIKRKTRVKLNNRSYDNAKSYR